MLGVEYFVQHLVKFRCVVFCTTFSKIWSYKNQIKRGEEKHSLVITNEVNNFFLIFGSLSLKIKEF